MDVYFSYESAYVFNFPGNWATMNQMIDIAKSNPHQYKQLKTRSENYAINYIKEHLKANKEFKNHFPIKERCLVVCNVWLKDKRKDPDGAIGFALKVFLDALQRTKVLPNDGFKQINGFIHNFDIDSKNPRIELFLFPGDQINFIDETEEHASNSDSNKGEPK
jgi:hypothetical protein